MLKFFTSIIIMVSTFSISAQDRDQSVKDCGDYESSGHLECSRMEECYLILGKGNLTSQKIKLQGSKDITYFDTENVEMKISVKKNVGTTLAQFEEVPVKIVSAVGVSRLKLIKIQVCEK